MHTYPVTAYITCILSLINIQLTNNNDYNTATFSLYVYNRLRKYCPSLLSIKILTNGYLDLEMI